MEQAVLCRVVAGPIAVEEAVAAVVGSDRGALAVFAGLVRNHHRGRRVIGLEYHAYASMAEKVLGDIAAEAARRFGTPHIAIIHRIGPVAIGETSVIVAVASPHRKEALAACAFVIEALKARAPIWKKEHGEGGAVWIEGPEPTPSGEDSGAA
jgi:molybdopterin synthase catalytic subunit